jgi:hypothetical protein
LHPDDVKRALVALLIASYDIIIDSDELPVVEDPEGRMWNEIRRIIMDDIPLYEDILRYWSLPEEQGDDGFWITGRIREILRTGKMRE